MTKNFGSYAHIRTRTERVLRFMLRRKPCLVLAIAQLTAIISFVAMIIALAYMIKLTKAKGADIEEAKNLKNALLQEVNPWHCEYELPPSGVEKYDTTLCNLAFGDEAIAIALQKPVASAGNNCVPIIHEVQCHHNNEKEREFREINGNHINTQSCAGLFGSHMPYELVSSSMETLAPRMTNEELLTLNGELVFTSELLIKCPRCRTATHYYTHPDDVNLHNQICRRQLVTLRGGWPLLARFCDEEEITQVDLEQGVYC